ncbi:MAG: hypothetical protein WC467_03240 [Patescibacteria group bacterium]
MTQRFKNYLHDHKKLLIFSAIGFILLCLAALTPLFVKAMVEANAARDAIIQEKNVAIEEAIMNNDYATWSSLVTDKSLKAKITSDNFSQFTEVYRLLQQGKVEEANLIKKQLNLKQDFQVLTTKISEIDAAIMAGDYQAWRSIVGQGWKPEVNADNFVQFGETYKLIAQGKLKQANLLQQRLNLKVKYDYTSSR